MFDKLIDAISTFWETLLPFTVIKEYERAIILRVGKYNRTLGPGFHWMIPLGFESVHVDTVVPRTINLGNQSLITSDGVSVTISCIVTATINDIKKATLGIEDVDAAIVDSCYGAIGERVRRSSLEEITDPKFKTTLRNDCDRRAATYGIKIKSVSVADLSKTFGLRLMQ